MKTFPEFPNLFVVNHPLVQDKLSRMREKTCPTADFRVLLQKISMLMAYNVTEDMAMTTRQIVTPLIEMDAPTLAERDPVIVPILRAGLGLVDGLLTVFPDAIIAHVGLYRDEATHQPHEYLVRMPNPIPDDRRFIIVDPMLATGNSAVHAIDVLIARGVSKDKISLMTLVAAPEGVKTVHAKHPTAKIFTASLDSHLNEHAYIVPGLGDAGDRIFGTI
ncbi:MAG: uracil phosphoribosyltransferase [Alphaproteobacteria bacterium RIFCSPHIGHO2_02_FULL_46_13]|nr:MAG: uracil phosphoribosyltransferase [Alphaproteobacteria bacterium RIFCSPHIGHO2_02_FULL_46_13]